MSSDDPEYFPELNDQFSIQQLININHIVANCTTPANYFHLLRRQICLPFRYRTDKQNGILGMERLKQLLSMEGSIIKPTMDC